MAEYFPSIATRHALTHAAGGLFAEYGIDGVPVRDIAKAVNGNPGLIRYHFGSKDKLLEAVLDVATEKWHEGPLGRYESEI